MQDFDLVVLGAGCAGRSLVALAAVKGYRCAIIEHNPTVGYASIRNQGWLHSGALFAAIGPSFADDIVKACRQGESLLREFDRGHSLDAVGKYGCLMVYCDEQHLERELKAIGIHDIKAEQVSRSRLFELEPILGKDTIFVGGILTGDTTVNTVRILNKLSEVAHEAGCVFHVTSPQTLFDLGATHVDSGWLISCRNFQVRARVVVCACGVQIPSLVEHLVGVTLKGNISLAKCLVMAIKQPLCKRMIVMRSDDTNLMNLAPYEKGITVNLGHRDRPADSWSDEAIPLQTVQVLGDTLYDFLPGIRNCTAVESIPYTCQKLNIGRGRHFYCEEIHNDFFTFYPGKFTQCLHAAEWIVNNVLIQYGVPIPHLATHAIGTHRLLPSLNHPGSQAATLTFSFEGKAM